MSEICGLWIKLNTPEFVCSVAQAGLKFMAILLPQPPELTGVSHQATAST